MALHAVGHRQVAARVLTAQALHQVAHRDVRDGVDVLVHGGEVDRAECRERDVVKAGHRNLLRHRDSTTAQLQQRP